MSKRTIYALQVLSLALIWVFVLLIDIWILSLLKVSHDLNDAINASVGIGILAIPLFLTLASILTYVFFSLRKHRRSTEPSSVELEP